MERTIEVVKELQMQGLISDYALGGGSALLFYIEPVLTYDLDIFILLDTPEDRTLQSLTPYCLMNLFSGMAYTYNGRIIWSDIDEHNRTRF